MKKSIIVLNGPICAGKSTVTKLLMKNDNFFRGSYDAVKWLISNYSTDTKSHREIAKEIIFSAISIAAESGLSIVIDGGFADYRDKYKELAQKFNFHYVSINIEAPVEVLEKRFLERVDSASKVDSKNISVTTLEKFHSRYQWYLNTNKDLDGITFDSGKMSPEEIITEINALTLI
ncbi:MAG: AAA family ATPase [Candidatus Pacebacteria bacterium]|nr:AAA family ATPase [Candidatus Paceibacterota bacterium]